MALDSLLERRIRVFGKQSPLFYDKPLHLVRGAVRSLDPTCGSVSQVRARSGTFDSLPASASVSAFGWLDVACDPLVDDLRDIRGVVVHHEHVRVAADAAIGQVDPG